jgi:hypothetical protein
MSEGIFVWRGLTMSDNELVEIQYCIGRLISHKAHPWWTVNEGVASVYATTEQIKGDKIHRVVIKARLLNGPKVRSPLLPRLGSLAKLTLLEWNAK